MQVYKLLHARTQLVHFKRIYYVIKLAYLVEPLKFLKKWQDIKPLINNVACAAYAVH